jgi:hypothetical protein
MKPGKKMPTVATTAPQPPPITYPDERCGREYGAGRDLPDGYGIEELLLRQPVETVDEVRSQECEKHVPAAKDDRANLQERQEEREQADGGRHGDSAARDTSEEHGVRSALRLAELPLRDRRNASSDQHDHGVHVECRSHAGQSAECTEPEGLLDGLRSERPKRLDDDRDDDGLDAVENTRDLGHGAEPHVRPREGGDREGRRKNEAHASQQEPWPSSLLVADEDRELGGAGTRDEVGRAEQVQEPRGREPSSALDDLALHDGDVCRRSAERGEAETKKEERHLGELRARRGLGWCRTGKVALLPSPDVRIQRGAPGSYHRSWRQTLSPRRPAAGRDRVPQRRRALRGLHHHSRMLEVRS